MAYTFSATLLFKNEGAQNGPKFCSEHYRIIEVKSPKNKYKRNGNLLHNNRK